MDELERLVTELTDLVQSAASDEALESCVLLNKLARPDAPRVVLDRAIDHLRQSQGRTSDGERRNYPFSVIAAALDAVLAADAAAHGLEERYTAVAEAMGNTTAISGRRALPRLMRHLALAVFAVAPGDTGGQSAPSTASVESSVLRDVDGLDELVAMAITRRLAAQRAWRGPLASALASAYGRDPHAGVQTVAALLDGELSRRADPDTRLGALAVLLKVADAQAAVPNWGPACAEQICDLLTAPAASALLPPSATATREDAALALDGHGLHRLGTGTRATAHGPVPRHLFARLPSTGQRTLMSIFPTTVAQFRCFNRQYAADANLSSSHPVVDITCAEAENYCAWLQNVLTIDSELEIVQSAGRVIAVPRSPSGLIDLPTRGEVQSACQGSAPYAWSEAVGDEVGLARRRSYQRLIPVGLFADEASPVGVYDLFGLIWQWTSEAWDPGVATHRAVFGGGFEGADRFLEVGYFLGAPDHTRRPDRGFRIVIRG